MRTLTPRHFRGTSGSLIILVAAFISVFAYCGHQAATRALWTDDVHSLRIAEEPPAEMIAELSSGAAFFYEYPPLYFLLLHQVLKFGDGPFLVRLPSLTFTVLALAIWAWFARSRGLPLLLCIAAVVLAATHPMLAFQAIGVRMYAMLLLLATIPMVVCGGSHPAAQAKTSGELWTTRIRQMVPIGAVLALACYTAYFGLVVCAALALVAFLWLVVPRLGPAKARNVALILIGSCVIAGLLYLPWVSIAVKTLRGASTLDLPATSHEARYLALMREIPGTTIGAVMLAIGWIALCALGPQRWRRAFLCSLAPGILTLALLLLFSPSYRAIFTRYVLFMIPPIYLGAVGGWYMIARKINLKPAQSTAVAVVATIALCSVQIAAGQRTVFAPTPDWWAAARLVETQAGKNEVILTGGYMSGEAMLYHMKNPEQFQFRHYASTFEEFEKACHDPNVIWSVNAQAFPPRFASCHDDAFPHRIAFPGNAGLGMIQISCKHPFTVPPELQKHLVKRGPGNSDL